MFFLQNFLWHLNRFRSDLNLHNPRYIFSLVQICKFFVSFIFEKINLTNKKLLSLLTFWFFFSIVSVSFKSKQKKKIEIMFYVSLRNEHEKKNVFNIIRKIHKKKIAVKMHLPVLFPSYSYRQIYSLASSHF